jgi:transcriptional regulator with XRE-family HTH domain
MSELIQSDGYIQRDEFPARLRQVVDAYGSVTSLAKAIDRSDGAVRKWLRGVSEPNVSDLRALCSLTGANADWLVMGRGESGLPVHSVREPLSILPARVPSSMNYSLLETIMDTVDTELHSNGVAIASTKRSAMVVTLYSLFKESEVIDRDAVTRLIKLAA